MVSDQKLPNHFTSGKYTFCASRIGCEMKKILIYTPWDLFWGSKHYRNYYLTSKFPWPRRLVRLGSETQATALYSREESHISDDNTTRRPLPTLTVLPLLRGKTSNIGAALKEDLARHGIRVEQGRRKGAKLTCFTSLLEGKHWWFYRNLNNS